MVAVDVYAVILTILCPHALGEFHSITRCTYGLKYLIDYSETVGQSSIDGLELEVEY